MFKNFFNKIKLVKKINDVVNDVQDFLKNNKDKIDEAKKILEQFRDLIPQVKGPVNAAIEFIEKLKKWNGGKD